MFIVAFNFSKKLLNLIRQICFLAQAGNVTVIIFAGFRLPKRFAGDVRRYEAGSAEGGGLDSCVRGTRAGRDDRRVAGGETDEVICPSAGA